VCFDLKKDVRKLMRSLNVKSLKVDEKTLILYEDLGKLKETLSMKEEVFNTNLSKLESESLQLKQKIESLICENHQLLERLKKADLTANRRWNSSSEALKWLNTHQNRNKKGTKFCG